MKMHLLSLLILFFTINYSFAQNDKKLTTASFLSIDLIEKNYSTEFFHLKSNIELSKLCEMSKYDTVSIYLKNKSNILLLEHFIYWNDTQMRDTILAFKKSGYFKLDSNFVLHNYYSARCGGIHDSYYSRNVKKSAERYKHYKDTIEIPQEDLNYAMQHVYTESIGFIFYEANSDLRFNHASIIAGEKEWTITNNMGRIIQRGYLDAITGDNNYTIVIYDLPKGNYTLEIGDRSDAVYKSFTVR